MKLYNLNHSPLEICFGRFTQFAITDCHLANNIYQYICHYFSSCKYTEDILSKYNSEAPYIEVDDAIISRSAFQTFGISNFSDIDLFLRLKKGSPLMDYNKGLLDTIDLRSEVELLEQQYFHIQNKIKSLYPEDSLIEINDSVLDTDFLLSDHFSPYIRSCYSTFQKIMQLILLLETTAYSKCQNHLIFLHNVETYLTLQEVISIKNRCSKNDFVNLIISTQNPLFLDTSYLEEINFLHENTISNLPPAEILLDKVNHCIKSSTTISLSRFLEFLEDYAIDIVTPRKIMNSESQLILDALHSLAPQRKASSVEMDSCIII